MRPMKQQFIGWTGALALFVLMGCENDETPPYDTDFPIPRGVVFESNLSTYDLFEGPMDELVPAEGVILYELTSELFTDFASKQRLLKLPEGETATVGEDWEVSYPEGTIIAKTFYYPLDARNPEGERTILETRLLILNGENWNVATYRWNEEQTDGVLMLDGDTVPMAWTDEQGQPLSTNYRVPHEGECVTCHQKNGKSVFIGPTIASLNRSVLRDGEFRSQLEYLESEGVVESRVWESAPATANYKDPEDSPEDRARAYLHSNCAHCHNPGGWEEPADEGMDFRWETPLSQTGIPENRREILRQLESGQMPYLGTTLLHTEGLDVMESYLNSL